MPTYADAMAFAKNISKAFLEFEALRTCAMSIVAPVLPHRRSSEDIDLRACGTLWKDCSINRRMSLQHASEGALFLCTRSLRLVMERSRGVSSPCPVLAANVDDSQGLFVDDWAPMSWWKVMRLSVKANY